MARTRFHPALHKRLIGRTETNLVYSVNAFAIRNETKPDEEFTNFAVREDFPNLVPRGELWISSGLVEGEAAFFIANADARLDALAAGASEARAYTIGLNAERKLRRSRTGIEYRAGRPHRRIPSRIYVRSLCQLPDPKRTLHAFLVEGLVVRSTYKTDYAEGGHGYVYPWVPKGEIWIETAIEGAEIPFILAHEYTELRLMRDLGYEYDRAHEIAARVEFDLRKPNTRVRFPGFQRRCPHKDDMNKLTTAEYFEFVCSHYCRGAVGRLGSAFSNLAKKVLT